MANFTCDNCGVDFKRDKSGAKPIRFCSHPCYIAWRVKNRIHTGPFVKGFSPWNKGKKGLHLSPDTEFQKGQTPVNHQPVGTVNVRQGKSSNDSARAWVKIAEPNVWRLRAVVVWESKNGSVPKGMVIHHRDRNALNDSIDNLELLTRAAHLAEHRQEQNGRKRSESLKEAWRRRRKTDSLTASVR